MHLHDFGGEALPAHRIVEFGRPAEEISLQEQMDTGGQLNYRQSRPGRFASARCSCGERREGSFEEVFTWAKGHASADGDTPRRTIRVSDVLWEATQAKAQEKGTDVSTVIRKALERFVKRR